MVKSKIAIQTLGCKLNFAESSTIARQFKVNGYETVGYKDFADINVIHTCSVTSQAESKCRAAIRQARKRNSDGVVVVIGCYSQLKPDELKSMKAADLILGNHEKHNLYNILNDYKRKKNPLSLVSDIHQSEIFPTAYSSGDRTRSFLKIQDGCDYYCSYCIIPLARGKSRSQTIKEIVETAEIIASSEAKEIILTGVNIGDFGKPNKEKLIDLMHQLDTIKGIERIRISSIEPDLLTDDIIDFIHLSNKFLPHFHIPLQSGSNKILSLMKRKYRRELFEVKVLRIKEIMPFACIAADIITGFPEESDEDYNETFEFIKSLPISYLHVFPYSERPNTMASKITDKTQSSIIKQRSNLLHHLSALKKTEFYKENIGRQVNVLFESSNYDGYIQGFSDNYLRVKSQFNPKMINIIIKVELRKIDNDGLFVTNNTN